MKKLRRITVQSILSLCLMAALMPACAQDKKPSVSTEKNLTAQVPDVDIHGAVLYGNLEAVNQHIAAGTDLNTKEPMGGSTPLISAITFDHRDIAKALIDGGADLEIQNKDGSSALHVAAFFCRVEILQLLIDANVDRSKKNRFGATAFETVSGPFADIKPVYEMMQLQLGPLGLKLNLADLEKNRPVVAEILK